jgi:hypothetical protein
MTGRYRKKEEMERRTFIETAAKVLAVSPWLALDAEALPSTQNESKNGSKGGSSMSNYTHNTVPTQFVETKGIRFAYRRFGKKGGVPLVFNMHLNGNMDMWDPRRWLRMQSPSSKRSA